MPSWFLTVMPTGTSWGIFFILLVGVLALLFCFMGWHVLRAVLSSKITWIGLVIVLVAFILLAPKKIDEKKGNRIYVQHMVNAISTYVERQQTITLLRVRADSIFSYDYYRRKGEERKKVGKAVREIRGHGDLRIDLTKVEIKWDEATKTITVTLPSPQVYEPTVDTEAENLYWRNEGEVNQEGLADMLSRVAQSKIAQTVGAEYYLSLAKEQAEKLFENLFCCTGQTVKIVWTENEEAYFEEVLPENDGAHNAP